MGHELFQAFSWTLQCHWCAAGFRWMEILYGRGYEFFLCGFREWPRTGILEQGSSCLEALRDPENMKGYCLKVKEESLRCGGDIKILRIPQPRYIYQAELHTGNGRSPDQKFVLQAAKLEGLSHLNPLTLKLDLQDLLFSLIGSVLFWSVISLLCSYSSLLEWGGIILYYNI